ncbi:MAG: lipopolysaccharide biosynthesis protein [Cyclobacteriaceae bacterium]
MSFKKQFLSGTFWTSINQFSLTFLNFGISVVLARLITPEEFGTIALILVFSGFATILIDSGLSSAVVQFKEFNDEQLSTIFWCNLALGTVVTGLFMIMAKPIATFYNDPSISTYTIVLSFIFTLSSLSLVQSSLLSRNFQFKKLTWISLISTVLSGLLAIALAVSNYEIWSLIWQRLAYTLVNLILLWFYSTWRPTFSFDWNILKKAWGFSSNLLYLSSFNYWTKNTDNLLIGKFIGAEALGYYNRAYMLMKLPSNLVNTIITKVAFPIFSKYKDDLNIIRNSFLNISYVLFLVSIPFSIVLSIYSFEIVIAIFGDNWYESGGLLKILALAIPFSIILSLNGPVYQSQEKTKLLFTTHIYAEIFAILLVIGSVFISIYAIAWAVLIYTSLAYLYITYFVLKVLKIAVIQYLNTMKNVFLSCGIAWLFHYLVLDDYLHRFDKLTSLLFLVISVFTSLILFFGLSVLLNFNQLKMSLKILKAK